MKSDLTNNVPQAPLREKWDFIKQLKTSLPLCFHWDKTIPENTLDLSNGVEYRAGFHDERGYLKTADDDFRHFLKVAGLLKGMNGIVISTGKDSNLKSGAFRIEAKPGGILISGSDAEGIRHGIYFLEDQLLSSSGPFLKLGITERVPWIKNRISRCFFGPIKRPPFNNDELLDDIDYYPDEYLNRLAHEGINGLWLTVAFQDLCKTSFTELPPNAKQRLDKLRKTVEKCLRYGIKTWAFCIEPHGLTPDAPLFKAHPELAGAKCQAKVGFCTSVPQTQQYLYECTNWIFAQVPGLGGMINISHGERDTTCLSSVLSFEEIDVKCPRCSQIPKWEILHRSLSAMRRGMHDAAPAAELISWFYMPSPEKHGDWVFELARHIPDGVIMQYNFESNGAIRQLDRMRIGGDYWLSYVGPSDDFARMAENAAAAGTEVSAKIQVGCSHEVATVPFVPVPAILYQKYKQMHKSGVGHVMQCWYFGNYPGIMNKAAGRLAYENFSSSEKDFLESLARPEWGKHAPEMAEAWKYFSEAYKNYPVSNMMQYYGPAHFGPTWPLYLEPAMLPLSPTWKPDFPPSGDIIGECLENHTLNEALFLFRRLSGGWNKGLEIIRRIAPDFSSEPERMLDIGIAEALGIQFDSACNIFHYYQLRRSLLFEDADVLEKMEALVKLEINNSLKLKKLCECDSRLGFHSEAESHLYYKEKLAWRVEQLETLLDKDFSRARKGEKLNTKADLPVWKIGSGTCRMENFKWNITREADDLIICFDCIPSETFDSDTVSISTLDIAGTRMPWLITISADGKVLDNRNIADVSFDRGNSSWSAAVRLPSLYWNNAELDRPYYFMIERRLSSIGKDDIAFAWPENRAKTRYRLYLDFYLPQNMGRLE